MIVKFKKLHPNAVIPKASLTGDVGLDLTVTEIVDRNEFIECKFGVAVEIPNGHFGMLTPRSNITKMNLMMKNGIGIIDSGYRGELVCRFKKVKFEDGTQEQLYKVGERAAQLIILPYPQITVWESNTLSETERGTGGFGSTGLAEVKRTESEIY